MSARIAWQLQCDRAQSEALPAEGASSGARAAPLAFIRGSVKDNRLSCLPVVAQEANSSQFLHATLSS